MKVNDFLAGLTALIVLSMQIASITALYVGKLEFAGYTAIWTPILTLVMGYWFRGTQTAQGAS